MSSFDVLHERLVALQETTTQLRELIDRLATIKFQPGSVPLGTDEENSVSGELSSEITSILRSGLEDQELLQEEVSYLRQDGDDRARLQEGTWKVGQELSSYRTAFRKARLSARKSLLDAQKLERQLVMQSYAQPEATPTDDDANDVEAPAPAPMQQILRRRPGQHNHSSLTEKDQETVGASSNVTNSLRRTHDIIASELSRSEFAHQTLTESSAALKSLNESYGSLDSMLARSKDLLGTLVKSQKSDTWYLQTAMYMLMTTLAWLAFRRLLYGPMWWFVFVPLKIALGLGSKATSVAVGAGKSVVGGLSNAGLKEGKTEAVVDMEAPKVNIKDETPSKEKIVDDAVKMAEKETKERQARLAEERKKKELENNEKEKKEIEEEEKQKEMAEEKKRKEDQKEKEREEKEKKESEEKKKKELEEKEKEKKELEEKKKKELEEKEKAKKEQEQKEQEQKEMEMEMKEKEMKEQEQRDQEKKAKEEKERQLQEQQQKEQEKKDELQKQKAKEQEKPKPAEQKQPAQKADKPKEAPKKPAEKKTQADVVKDAVKGALRKEEAAKKASKAAKESAKEPPKEPVHVVDEL